MCETAPWKTMKQLTWSALLATMPSPRPGVDDGRMPCNVMPKEATARDTNSTANAATSLGCDPDKPYTGATIARFSPAQDYIPEWNCKIEWLSNHGLQLRICRWMGV